jgi:hypothetical protein
MSVVVNASRVQRKMKIYASKILPKLNTKGLQDPTFSLVANDVFSIINVPFLAIAS